MHNNINYDVRRWCFIMNYFENNLYLGSRDLDFMFTQKILYDERWDIVNKLQIINKMKNINIHIKL